MEFTLKELSEKFGIKIETLRGILKRKKINPVGYKLVKKHKEQLFKLSHIKKALKEHIKIIEIPTFYNKEVIEVYHIYESKMNYLNEL